MGSGRELWRSSTHADTVWAVAFSPDGRTLATSSQDHSIRLWDVSSGNQTLRLDAGDAGAVAFSPDGRALAGGVGSSVVVWDVAAGTQIRKLATRGTRVVSIAFSPDGRRIAACAVGQDGSGSEATLRDATTGTEIRRFAQQAKTVMSTSVAFSPDGRSMLTAIAEPNGGSNEAILWDIASGNEIRHFRGHTAEVYSASFSPDGAFLATASADRTVRMWDATSGNEIRRFESHGHTGGVNSLDFSPDGELVLTGGTDAARLWDAESGEEVRVLRLTTPDGKPLPRSFSVSSVAFIADGKYALGGLSDLSGDFNAAALWEVASGNVMSLIGGKQVPLDSVSLGVRTAALSPDGSSILAASEDHTVRLWDLATGHEIHSFTGHAGPVKSAAFSKTEKALIVTAGSDGTARILDAATFREILKLNASSEDLATAVFSPDGTKVATAGWDRVISLWNVADGRQIRRLEGHLGIVWSLSFSPDGRLLLSASADGTARLWNVADGRELCRLVSFPDGVWVVVDPEGRFDTNYPDQIRGLKWIPPDDPLRPVPVEIFMREYYEPQLLARIVAGKAFKPVRPIMSINRLQPNVKIVDIEPGTPGTVNVTVEVGGPSAFDLRLFRDGQMVAYKAGNNAAGRQTFTGIQIPSGPAGETVSFTAYAFNEDKIKSETSVQPYTYAAAVTAKARRAYIISLGVNYNEMQALRLAMGVNDARRTCESLAAALLKTGE